MISTFFLFLFSSFVSLLLAIMPAGHLPAAFTTSFAYFFNTANQFSYVVPIATLMQAFSLVLVVDGAILVWHFMNWVIRKIPGMQ